MKRNELLLEINCFCVLIELGFHLVKDARVLQVKIIASSLVFIKILTASTLLIGLC